MGGPCRFRASTRRCPHDQASALGLPERQRRHDRRQRLGERLLDPARVSSIDCRPWTAPGARPASKPPTRSPWAARRRSTSSAASPRLAAAARAGSSGAQITSQTSSQARARPPSTSLIASTTTNGAAAASALASSSWTRRRTCGWTIASRSASALGSANTIRASAARSRTPAASTTPVAEALPDRGHGRLTGCGRASGERRRRRSTKPPRRPSIRATVDLPQPIGPVSPMRNGRSARHPPGPTAGRRRCGPGHRGARSESASHASSAWASAASTSASSLVSRRSSTKLVCTRGSPSASSSCDLRSPRRVRSSSTRPIWRR